MYNMHRQYEKRRTHTGKDVIKRTKTDPNRKTLKNKVNEIQERRNGRGRKRNSVSEREREREGDKKK